MCALVLSQQTRTPRPSGTAGGDRGVQPLSPDGTAAESWTAASVGLCKPRSSRGNGLGMQSQRLVFVTKQHLSPFIPIGSAAEAVGAAGMGTRGASSTPTPRKQQARGPCCPGPVPCVPASSAGCSPPPHPALPSRELTCRGLEKVGGFRFGNALLFNLSCGLLSSSNTAPGKIQLPSCIRLALSDVERR